MRGQRYPAEKLSQPFQEPSQLARKPSRPVLKLSQLAQEPFGQTENRRFELELAAWAEQAHFDFEYTGMGKNNKKMKFFWGKSHQKFS